jgi:hypothetical protein
MDLFNNKNNDRLKFKINAEGINTSDFEARLVFTTDKKINYVIYGDIRENMCYFDVPELSIYEKDSSGKLKFELVSEDLYFNIWQDSFNIKSKSTIKIDEMIRETQESEKPKINVILECETKPEYESPKVDATVESESSDDIEEVRVDNVPVKKKQRIKESNDESFLSFSEYLKNNG